jgi:hypothetical protein
VVSTGNGEEGVMAIVSSADGKIYVVPEKDLERYKIAPEDLEEKIKASGLKEPPGVYPQQTRSDFNNMRLCLKR